MTQRYLRRARRAVRQLFRALLPILILMWGASAYADNTEPALTSGTNGCFDDPAIETDGKRKLALLVGVADYKSRRIPDLSGPENDVDNMRDLLTSADGYGFPARNVCVLLNEEATTANFKKRFRTHLIDRAQPDDTVVIFFAGHGSQTRDAGGDETDGWDETLLFHDSRVNGVRDFPDDALYSLLAQLHAKTRDVTLILDACSSGTAMRSTSRYRARFVPPQKTISAQPIERDAVDSAVAAESLQGLVTLAAAADGLPAVERDGHGIFTQALLGAIKSGTSSPLTYADLARRVPLTMAAYGKQVPVFSGELERSVFSTATQVTARSTGSMLEPETLKVAVRVSSDETKLEQRRSQLNRELLANTPAGVEMVNRDEDLEVLVVAQDRIEIRVPDNTVVNALATPVETVAALNRHVRLQELGATRGSSANFEDQKSLRLRLIPAAQQPPCADGVWRQASLNSAQTIPLCHNWQVEVSLEPAAPSALNVQVVVASVDGSTFSLPGNGKGLQLNPGDVHVFKDGATFRGLPPLGSNDRVYAMGRETIEDSSVAAVSSIAIRVEANSGFENRLSGPFKPREYTIENFDLRPYLPANPEAPLHRVLQKAHEMTLTAGDDGLPYRQHDWSKRSDAENLAVGIDCSRAIWFAFTRVGLPYNESNGYLHTAAMIGDNTPMHDEFDLCPENEPYQLGDVLVYRSDKRGDGHTVMVIDPDKRIAWGSHGWDGNPQASGGAVAPDKGVEYQRIKFKPDWARWDRRDMTFRACWRYRKFSPVDDSVLTSTESLVTDPCNADRCPLQSPIQ